MTNRREFLRTGVSVSALPLANGLVSARASARSETGNIALRKAIFDDRYAECRTFAKSIREFGVPAQALKRGDATDLWARERVALRKSPAAIAGSTQFGPMLVFEQLGRDYGVRLRLRVEHRPLGDGTIAHVMAGPADTLALADHSRFRNAEWPVLMAALLAHCRVDASPPVERTLVTPGARPALRQAPVFPNANGPEPVIHYYTPQAIREGHDVPWDGPLFSWVMMPAVGAPSLHP